MAAVNKDGYALEFANDKLRADKEVVVAAINDIGWVIKYAGNELRGDKEVMLAAIKKNGFNLEFASSELRDLKEKYGVDTLEMEAADKELVVLLNKRLCGDVCILKNRL